MGDARRAGRGPFDLRRALPFSQPGILYRGVGRRSVWFGPGMAKRDHLVEALGDDRGATRRCWFRRREGDPTAWRSRPAGRQAILLPISDRRAVYLRRGPHG